MVNKQETEARPKSQSASLALEITDANSLVKFLATVANEIGSGVLREETAKTMLIASNQIVRITEIGYKARQLAYKHGVEHEPLRLAD